MLWFKLKPWFEQKPCFASKPCFTQSAVLHKNCVVHEHRVLHKNHVLAGPVQALFAACRIFLALSMVARGTKKALKKMSRQMEVEPC
jgi:hypothetical protein